MKHPISQAHHPAHAISQAAHQPQPPHPKGASLIESFDQGDAADSPCGPFPSGAGLSCSRL